MAAMAAMAAMAEMNIVVPEDKATETVLGAVENASLIGCDPTPILEYSATALTKILIDSIEKEPLFKKLDDESKCNARNTVLSVGLHHKICLKIIIKMVEVGLVFSVEWRKEDKIFM